MGGSSGLRTRADGELLAGHSGGVRTAPGGLEGAGPHVVRSRQPGSRPEDAGRMSYRDALGGGVHRVTADTMSLPSPFAPTVRVARTLLGLLVIVIAGSPPAVAIRPRPPAHRYHPQARSSRWWRRTCRSTASGWEPRSEMVRRGYTHALTVPPNIRYERRFEQAETEARVTGRGLWGSGDLGRRPNNASPPVVASASSVVPRAPASSRLPSGGPARAGPHALGGQPVEEPRGGVRWARPRVRPQHRLVDLRAPAGGGREQDVAVLDHRGPADEVGFPRHVVGVDLHDAHVRQHRAQVQRVQVGQVAVVVVRGDVDLVGLGHAADLHGLGEAVPGHVDDGHVHRVALEERPVLAGADEALARGQARGGRLLDLEQRLRVPGVVLEPLEVEALQEPGDAQRALRAVVVVQVQAQADP